MNSFRFPQKLAKSGVALVYLFGSQAVGLSTPLSKVGVKVALKNSKEAFEIEIWKKFTLNSVKFLFYLLCSPISQGNPGHSFSLVQILFKS